MQVTLLLQDSPSGSPESPGLNHLPGQTLGTGSFARLGLLSIAAVALVALTGCGHKQHVAYVPPPPPSPAYNTAPPPYRTFPPSGRGETAPVAPVAPTAGGEVAADSQADLEYVQSHSPIWAETGTASWYGPPYNRRRGANGEVFDQNMLSAAHRTLPMGSLIRVTNMHTGQMSVMRVTDRGPFVPGRVLDLSVASAKAIGVYLPGTAMVQIQVYAAPKAIGDGGRWCVQVGAFQSEGKARKLQSELQHRYSQANVIEFTGPTGHWVRIRPLGDNRQQAQEIEDWIHPEQGEAYLTRLD